MLAVPLLLPAGLRAEHRVYVPIEARASAGIPVPGATLRFGAPLTASSQVRNVSELVLTGVTSYRLAPGVRRPDGSLEWVLVVARVDLPGGGLSTQLVLTTGAGATDPSASGGELPEESAGVHVTLQRGADLGVDSLAQDPLLRAEALLEGSGPLGDDVHAAVRALRSGRLPAAARVDSLRRAGQPVALAVAARLTSTGEDLTEAFRALEAAPWDQPEDLPGALALELRAALLLLGDRARTDEEADLLDDVTERVALTLGSPIELPPGLRWKVLPLSRAPEGVSFVVPRGLRRVRIKHAPSPIAAEAPSSRASGLAFWAATNVHGERASAPPGATTLLRVPIPEGHHVAGRYLEDAALVRSVVTFRPRSRGLSPTALLVGLASTLGAGLLFARIMRGKK